MLVSGTALSMNPVRLDGLVSSGMRGAPEDSATLARQDLRAVRRQVLELAHTLKSLIVDTASVSGAQDADSFAPSGTRQMKSEGALSATVDATANHRSASVKLPDFVTQLDLSSEDLTKQSFEDHLSEFDRTLSSLFDDSTLLMKPGPILKVLRENIRSSVTSVFNNRGPGFIPPFHFGFNFPAEPDPLTQESESKQAILTSLQADPQPVVEFL